MPLYIKNISIKGRGVFSTEFISEGQLIELCPVLLITDPVERQLLKETALGDYLFTWDDEKTISALALGFGSLYNHSVHCNAGYIMDQEEKKIKFIAVTDIAPHEEITINYNGERGKEGLDWFKERGIMYKD